MIRVTMTMTSPNTGEIREIGELLITNEGDEGEFGTYQFRVNEGTHPIIGVPLRCSGKVEGHPRRQTAWALVEAALSQALRKKRMH